MTERPILFSAPMVRALLAGTKTQTRRVVKLVGADVIEERVVGSGEATSEEPWPFSATWSHGDAGSPWYACPYGAPGERLWVRETWKVSSESNHYPTDEKHLYVEFRAGAVAGTGQQRSKFSVERDAELARAAWGNGKSHAWRPSIHMPRWASRITLEVTDVRVERLFDCSTADAIAEGIDIQDGIDPRLTFANLWESINGAGSWAANPWVWVVEFKRVTP